MCPSALSRAGDYSGRISATNSISRDLRTFRDMTGPNQKDLHSTGIAGGELASRGLSRRSFLALGSAATATIAGCAGPQTTRQFMTDTRPVFREPANRGSGLTAGSSYYDSMYGPKLDEPFPLPAIPYQEIDPAFLRQEVPDPTGERPGTLVVARRSARLGDWLDAGD